MRSLYELGILAAVVVIWTLVLYFYGDDMYNALFVYEETYLIYVEEVAFEVTVADSPEERQQGLSGVESLEDFGGKLFIFDEADQHGIWMKDMQFALDILWFDENLELIHIAENISPNTYPDVFIPPRPAWFVLELNALTADTLKIEPGDRLSVPAALLPTPVRRNIQNQ